jgi:1-acyl-sn-glycerol-3-phosphate acyltransferase
MLVDRGGSTEAAKQMLSEATERLKKGEIMAIFPEGTRNKTDVPILPFKKGAFILAKHTGAPLIPLAILNSGNLWPSGSYIPKPGLIQVAIGRPIIPDRSSSLIEMSRTAQKVLTELYQELETRARKPGNED